MEDIVFVVYCIDIHWYIDFIWKIKMNIITNNVQC